MFTLNDILQGNASNAHIHSSIAPDPNLVFHAAHHDSRQIEHGDLYVAIKGHKIDGHRFTSTVAQSGALGALCNEPVADVPQDFLQIVVPDVIEALHATARIRTQRQP